MEPTNYCEQHNMKASSAYSKYKCRCDDCVSYRRWYNEVNRDKRNAWAKADRKANPEKYRRWNKTGRTNQQAKDPDAQYFHQVKHKYGITRDEYMTMLDDQDCKCKICEKDIGVRQCVVDHCHTSLEVRGLLCNNCNVLLGHAFDDPATLRSAIRYLGG